MAEAFTVGFGLAPLLWAIKGHYLTSNELCLRGAKVGKLWDPILVQNDVGWLEIPVHHIAGA